MCILCDFLYSFSSFSLYLNMISNLFPTFAVKALFLNSPLLFLTPYFSQRKLNFFKFLPKMGKEMG